LGNGEVVEEEEDDEEGKERDLKGKEK
jgi:hypothetical protein